MCHSPASPAGSLASNPRRIYSEARYNRYVRFVVLSSSRGTTFQAIIDAMHKKTLTATCLGLITDRDDRGCIEKAAAAGLPIIVVKKREDEGREEYDRRLHDAIIDLLGGEETSRDDVVIAAIGWMFVLSSWFIEHWRGRILNVHPSLL